MRPRVFKVFADDPEEKSCLVQEPGHCIITAGAFVFGRKDGRGCIQSRGAMILDFGEGIGRIEINGWEMLITLPEKT